MTEGHARPAIVLSRLDEVELIATIGAMFRRQHCAVGMHREAQRIAMPIGEHRGLGVAALHEGIVVGDGAVIAQAQHLAGGHVQVLRDVASGRADDGVEHSIRAKGDARSTGAFGITDEDFLHLRQRLAVELRPLNCQLALLPARCIAHTRDQVARLVEGEIHQDW